jgi:hypothetical protein
MKSNSGLTRTASVSRQNAVLLLGGINTGPTVENETLSLSDGAIVKAALNSVWNAPVILSRQSDYRRACGEDIRNRRRYQRHRRLQQSEHRRIASYWF